MFSLIVDSMASRRDDNLDSFQYVVIITKVDKVVSSKSLKKTIRDVREHTNELSKIIYQPLVTDTDQKEISDVIPIICYSSVSKIGADDTLKLQ